MKKKTELLACANRLPEKAGCYLFKSQKDCNNLKEILYVGKAINLKGRVVSYFNNSEKTIKTEILVKQIDEIDFIVTKTEAEAFVLESNLIKKFLPKYNILLKDDKSYPYIVINHNEPFPKLSYERKVIKDKFKDVFGPFPHGSGISDLIKILNKAFGLRDCTVKEFKRRKNACILYDMGRCTAPCVKKISEEDYNKNLEKLLNFFKGDPANVLEYLENKMNYLAKSEQFEFAASYRDYIITINEFLKKSYLDNNVEFSFPKKDLDSISFYEGDSEIDISIGLIRDNLLIGKKSFYFATEFFDRDIEDGVLSFILQYYNDSKNVLPKVIVTSFSKTRLKLLEEALNIQVGTDKNIKIIDGTKKDYCKLQEITLENAKEQYKYRQKNKSSTFIGLNKLKDLLKLNERPVVLECFDVAIWQGKSPTASQIVFHEGVPNRSLYRHYHLKERVEGNNDYEMMKELLKRRIKKGNFPDIFVVDGGKGQLNALLTVLKELDVVVPVVAIAKSKVKNVKKYDQKIERTNERLFIQGRINPYILSKNLPLFRILTHIRDEAHRFSRRLHHHAEKKRLLPDN